MLNNEAPPSVKLNKHIIQYSGIIFIKQDQHDKSRWFALMVVRDPSSEADRNYGSKWNIGAERDVSRLGRWGQKSFWNLRQHHFWFTSSPTSKRRAIISCINQTRKMEPERESDNCSSIHLTSKSEFKVQSSLFLLINFEFSWSETHNRTSNMISCFWNQVSTHVWLVQRVKLTKLERNIARLKYHAWEWNYWYTLRVHK